ncbi:MAG: ABC transporter permease [Candidatus Dadabacteria bacterium]|nr:MAG: ABC transporter permease [Candidatus Dadabacteria bacterium]
MAAYLRKRLLVAVPVVFGVVTVVFSLVHVLPGDPVDALLGQAARPADRIELRHRLGLDRPLAQQYAAFVGGLLRGDLGRSLTRGVPVSRLIAERLPATAVLAAAGLAISLFIGIPLGVLAAARPASAVDRLGLSASLLGVAMPNFWLGPTLALVFAVRLAWLPLAGSGSPAHLVLPALTLGTSAAGILARITRASVLEVLHEDWIQTARAKGLSETAVLVRHGLANALVPIISVAGLELGGLLAGSIITETIFAWPGIGRLLVEAITARDYPVVQGCVLVIAIGYVLVNLLTDLAYAWADPRVRYGEVDG